MSGPGAPKQCPHGLGFNCGTCYPRPRYDFKAMRENLRTGKAVTVAVAPHLFPTPPDVAARLVELLDLDSWAGEAWETLRVLEPSAGTGNLIAAVLDAYPEADIYAWEINHALADGLRAKWPDGNPVRVVTGDFLCKVPPDSPAEQFDAVAMNPPFNGFDWKHHLRHAWRFVKNGGRLAAVLPQAPSVRDVVRALDPGASIEPLPDNTFAGTGARTLLALLNKPE